MFRSLAFASLLIAAANGQKAGTEQEETHPPMNWQDCSSGTCKDVKANIVVDANWRWVHGLEDITNCYDGNEWDETLCPDNEACAKNCALEGADYEATYGITADGDSVSLKFVTEGGSTTNIGSRVYLMEDESTYQMFNLLNMEFSFDVDLSTLPCGLNGALYFVTMDADGGMERFPTNEAGAKYGTGYCDAQCARDLKFINGMVSTFSLLRSVLVLADMMLTSLENRVTLRAGCHLRTMPTLVSEATVLAAPRWMFGRPTPWARPSLLTAVTPPARLCARARAVAVPTPRSATTDLAILMVAISTLTAWVTTPSTVTVLPSTPALSSLLLLSSSLTRLVPSTR
jgi:hypothetical protein